MGNLGLKYIFIAVFVLFFAVKVDVSYAGAMPSEDQEHYLAAIEDYRFGDFVSAIQVLEKLHRAYPENVEVVQYIALSYRDMGDYSQAIDFYKQWVALLGMSLRSDLRDVWLGYVRVLQADHQLVQAADILKQWLAVHPDDHDARIVYGDLLVRQQQFDQAFVIWRQLLGQSNLSPVQQAAAHYYLALGAMQQNDYSLTREEAAKSLSAASDGRYADVARQLLDVRPVVRQQGFTGNILIGEFYTSNVELLPDIVQPSGGKQKGDAFTQADLTLGYQGSRWRLGYALNSSWHNKRKDFDLAVHSGFFDWDVDNWTISPRFEWVSLNKQQLYYGAGLDLSWINANWMFRYQGRYRKFSHAFGVLSSDLSRLGGFSNEVNVSRQAIWRGYSFIFGGHLHKESTKGDVTHNKTDDYTQLGLNASMGKTWEHIDVDFFAMGYWRGYARPDVTVLVATLEKRRDYYLQFGGHVGMKPFANQRHRIVLQGLWQHNISNYKAPLVVPQFSKEFTEWQVGVSWQYLW